MGCLKLPYQPQLKVLGKKSFLVKSAVEKNDHEQKKGVSSFTFAVSGMEQDNEVSGSGNSYTAEYWQYDSRLGRRFNLDPKPVTGISQYATFKNNPMFFVDPLGDTTYVNGTGDVVWQQFNEDGSLLDALVYQTNDEFTDHTYIGELGGELNVNDIMTNMLKEHRSEAIDMYLPEWFSKVNYAGEWDLKNTRESVRPGETETIFGVAWEFDHEKENSGNSKTKFSTENYLFLSAADVGNYHAGYTGSSVGISMTLQKFGAGAAEQVKLKGFWTALCPAHWGSFFNGSLGDAEKDYKWNTQGMKDAEFTKYNGGVNRH